ncbi:MAG TPA: hypothetical protein VF914_01750 [Chloroflexia bacterium]
MKVDLTQLKETPRGAGNALWTGAPERTAATNMDQYLCGCLNSYGVPQIWSGRSPEHAIAYGHGSATFAMLGR